MKQNNLTVVDFFCGAGGFSEGFRQKGFIIKYGYDYWKPATDTFNHNFGLSCSVKNILDFENSIDEIESVPDTDIIIGSPPCVSFSSSNKSGKADKSLGLKLTMCFLRVVAVKRHKPGSILKAWFMENVVNSRKYLQASYTFVDLGLTTWAEENKINPKNIAINLLENTTIINSADYGSLQARKRAISGEIAKYGKLLIPPITHRKKGTKGSLPIYKSIRTVKESFPNPYQKKSNKLVKDVLYPIEIPLQLITDHFYDTGVYLSEWKFSRYWKVNHPYMGKMSFPENIDNPSRTITATRIANSRESIIYKSEIERKGHGEYRLPTVREAATIMGFPITYQFLGSEHTKWRLVGNAVCSSVSGALAGLVLQAYKIKPREFFVLMPDLNGVVNLNTYSLKEFNSPPVKNKNSRFRRHPIKDGNLTVTLSNYCIAENSKADGKWMTSIQYGTGDGFPVQQIKDGYYQDLETVLKKWDSGKQFMKIINNGFSEKIGSAVEMQRMYELQQSFGKLVEPTELIEELIGLLESVEPEEQFFEQNEINIFLNKKKVPTKQLLALYAVNKISTIANLTKNT